MACRWRSDDNASLRRHPIYVARTVQQFFADLPPAYGISACLPLAAAEANINLSALKGQNGIGQQMRKFLSEQLKDRGDAKRTYRVRLAVSQMSRCIVALRFVSALSETDAAVGATRVRPFFDF